MGCKDKKNILINKVMNRIIPEDYLRYGFKRSQDNVTQRGPKA